MKSIYSEIVIQRDERQMEYDWLNDKNHEKKLTSAPHSRNVNTLKTFSIMHCHKSVLQSTVAHCINVTKHFSGKFQLFITICFNSVPLFFRLPLLLQHSLNCGKTFHFHQASTTYPCLSSVSGESPMCNARHLIFFPTFVDNVCSCACLIVLPTFSLSELVTTRSSLRQKHIKKAHTNDNNATLSF